MEKKKKSKVKVFGMKLKDLFSLVSILTAMFVGWQNLHSKISEVDHKSELRFQKIEYRLDSVNTSLNNVNARLDNIEHDLKKTSDLLDLYLTWRFIYVNDPARKNLVPVYDPRARTLDFVKRNPG